MLTVGYALEQLPGWAVLSLGDGARTVELEAAWSDDVLRDLVQGACDLLAGAPRLQVLLDAETSTAVLDVERRGDRVVVQARDAASGRMLFQARAPLRAFCAGVAQAAQAVLDLHGEAGYLERWCEHPFPSAELARLQAALAG